jgi:hypothetical protein
MMQQGVDTCKGDGGSPHICKKNGKAGWLNIFIKEKYLTKAKFCKHF